MKKHLISIAIITSLVACGSPSEDTDSGENSGSTSEAEPDGDTTNAQVATATFVNSRKNATSTELRTHYVDFSFDHPADWILDETPGERNYVRIHAPQINSVDTLIFHAGFAFGSGNQTADYAQLETLIPTLAQQFSQQFPNFRLLESKTGPIGTENGPGFTFEATMEPPMQHIRVYGRADAIIPEGQTKGLFMLTLATSESGVTSPDEIAEQPEFQMIFNSLSIG